MVVEEVPVAIGEGVDMLIQIVALRHRIEGTEPCHAFHMHPLIASGDETDVGNSIGKGPRSSFPSRSPTEGCVPSGLAGSMERLKKVVRGGRRIEVSIFDIVVGDIIPLKIGGQLANTTTSCLEGRKIVRNVVAMATGEAPTEVVTELPEKVKTIQDGICFAMGQG